MKLFKTILTILFISTILTSCGSDDSDNGSNNCGDYTDQIAQGNFKGENFTVQGGTHSVLGPKYFCRIYVSEKTGGSCGFPQFGGNEGVVIFSIPNLDANSYTLSDESGAENTLNFNSIENSITEIELAECGKIEIYENNGNIVTGRVFAKGQDGSKIDGNFTLELCN